MPQFQAPLQLNLGDIYLDSSPRRLLSFTSISAMGRKTSSKRKASRSAVKRSKLSKKAGTPANSITRRNAYEQFVSAELDAVSSLSACGIDEQNKFDLRKLAAVLGSFEDFKGTNYRLRITPKQVKMLHAVRYLLEEAASSVEKSLSDWYVYCSSCLLYSHIMLTVALIVRKRMMSVNSSPVTYICHYLNGTNCWSYQCPRLKWPYSFRILYLPVLRQPASERYGRSWGNWGRVCVTQPGSSNRRRTPAAPRAYILPVLTFSIAIAECSSCLPATICQKYEVLVVEF